MDNPTWDPKTIIVGIDGSTHSDHAAALAVSMARGTGAKLHVVNVMRPADGWWGIGEATPAPAGMDQSLKEAQRELLAETIGKLDLSGLDHDTYTDIGDPAGVLVGYAERVGADVLIIGKRGAGLIERLIIGSVANRVVHDAPCPVLLVA